MPLPVRKPRCPVCAQSGTLVTDPDTGYVSCSADGWTNAPASQPQPLAEPQPQQQQE